MIVKRFDLTQVKNSYMAYLLRTCTCCYLGDAMCKNADDHFGIIEFYIRYLTENVEKPEESLAQS